MGRDCVCRWKRPSCAKAGHAEQEGGRGVGVSTRVAGQESQVDLTLPAAAQGNAAKTALDNESSAAVTTAMSAAAAVLLTAAAVAL